MEFWIMTFLFIVLVIYTVTVDFKKTWWQDGRPKKTLKKERFLVQVLSWKRCEKNGRELESIGYYIAYYDRDTDSFEYDNEHPTIPRTANVKWRLV